MTNTQLQYIVAVDNYKNFAAAAEKCYVTQPTLSMQIQKLEEELGVLIFDRTKLPARPTQTGKKIIDQARKVLEETERIQDIINEEKDEITGTFTLGIIPTIAPNILPLFIEKFTNKHSKLNIVLEELQTNQIISKLRSDELDAGILVTPLHEKDIYEESIFYEPFVAYISKGHRLWSRKNIQTNELSQNDLFLLKEGHCFRDHVIQICKQFGDKEHKQEQRINFEGGSLETLRKMVENNFGMTLLPYLSLKDLKNTDKVKHVRKFAEPVPFREVSLVYRRAKLKKKIREALFDELVKIVPPKLHNRPEGFVVG